VGDRGVRIYIRYSKLHKGNKTFYGLRARDLRELEGRESFICFLWDGQGEPLLIPYSEYEEVFQTTAPAPDGQYKSQIFLRPDGTELYVASAGRFNVEGHLGWNSLMAAAGPTGPETGPLLAHAQVQTLLGAIGSWKGYDVWIPMTDRGSLDWSLVPRFECRTDVSLAYGEVTNVIREVDVIWVARGSTDFRALFEVEHSTPIYSGLLRFNDIHLAVRQLKATFNIVANDLRRATFVRQLQRPTFRASGLSDLCRFLNYADVAGWYRRLAEAV
jgi:hypothetical protein